MNGTMEDLTQAQPFIAATEKREPRLLDRVREALRVRHMSLRTEKTYVHWIRRFILFHQKRHPKDMAEAEINPFLTHLAVEGRVSPSTQTQALCALLFLYRHVLDREIGELEGLVRARRTRRLPVVLTPEEVKSMRLGPASCVALAAFANATFRHSRPFPCRLYGTVSRVDDDSEEV